jgi:hypothetical protein
VKSGRMADPRTARVVDLKADITSTRVRSTTCSSWSASSSMPSATRNGSASVGHAHHGCPRGCAGLLQASFDGVFLVADRPSLIEGAGKLQPTPVVADLALAESERLYSGRSRTMNHGRFAGLLRQAPPALPFPRARVLDVDFREHCAPARKQLHKLVRGPGPYSVRANIQCGARIGKPQATTDVYAKK